MKKEDSRFGESTVFEGMTSVRACLFAWENGVSDRRLTTVYYDETKEKRLPALPYLLAMSRKLGFALTPCPAGEIDRMAVGSTHGGILALGTKRTVPPLSSAVFSERKRIRTGAGETPDGENKEKEEFPSSLILPSDGFYVMLEGIEDPYNFGYALRSLYACGADGVILSPRNWMSAAGVVCRSSAGASERLPLFEAAPEEAAQRMKAHGYRVICAGIRDAVSSFDCDLRRPVFLAIGGEKRGLSRSLLAQADSVVRIDYAGAFQGSLSVASAAAILAYEVMRNNR